MIITRDMINKAADHGACLDGLKWAESVLGEELNPDNVVSAHLLWVSNIDIEIEPLSLLEYCCKQLPGTALLYSASILPAELLDYCARQDPSTAIAFVAGRLPKITLDYCVRKFPEDALEFSKHLLTPELLKHCQEATQK